MATTRAGHGKRTLTGGSVNRKNTPTKTSFRLKPHTLRHSTSRLRLMGRPVNFKNRPTRTLDRLKPDTRRHTTSQLLASPSSLKVRIRSDALRTSSRTSRPKVEYPRYFEQPKYGKPSAKTGGTFMEVILGPSAHDLTNRGSIPDKNTTMMKPLKGKDWVAGHLHSELLGGPGIAKNLTPLTSDANKNHDKQVEEKIKNLVTQHCSLLETEYKLTDPRRLKPKKMNEIEARGVRYKVTRGPTKTKDGITACISLECQWNIFYYKYDGKDKDGKDKWNILPIQTRQGNDGNLPFSHT